MKLTAEQRNILNGERGELLQYAMSCLVKYGIGMAATELIDISNVHTFISSPEHLTRIFTRPGTEISPRRVTQVMKMLETLRVKVKTTTSPNPTFLESRSKIGKDETFYEKDEALELVIKMGMQPTLSCAPYLAGNVPILGEKCSWLESSAIVYINSILGARTNREGVESTLFSALIGATPNFGLLLDENRRGTHLIDVRCELKNLSDWGALGFFAGEIAGLGIPVFTNLRRPSLEEAKQLSAALATSGGVPMFHIVGITPEASSLKDAFGGNNPISTSIFDETTKNEIFKQLNYESKGKVDIVCVGCPHASLSEIDEIARLIQGRHVAKDTKLWVLTGHATRALAERQRSAQIIESSGGRFIEGCPISTNIDTTLTQTMATNSAKMAFYSVN